VCIIQSGARKGQECGKKVTANNRCGIHQKKCVESRLVVIPAPAVAEPPVVVEPSVAVEPSAVVEPDSNTCICILQSGIRKGQKCGKGVVANNRCGIHQKKCVEPPRAEQPLQQTQQAPKKCQCIIQSGKKQGQVCGRSVTDGTLYCKSHKGSCILPKEPEPIVEPSEPKELLEPEPVIEIQPDPDQYEETKEPIEPTLPQEPIETNTWTVISSTEEEFIRFLEKTPIVDISVEQLSRLENEIIKCFS
jgi:hypothetical protein